MFALIQVRCRILTTILLKKNREIQRDAQIRAKMFAGGLVFRVNLFSKKAERQNPYFCFFKNNPYQAVHP